MMITKVRTMKQLMIPILLLLGYTSLDAQSFEWARSFGGTTSEWPTDIKTDHSGNVYSIGYFEDSVDFDPGSGVDMRYSNGSQDFYIQKLDNNGNLIWVKTFGGVSVDRGQSLNVDNAGNVFITGSFTDTVDFDPGPNTFQLVSRQPIIGVFYVSTFILKLNKDGDFVWALSYDIGQFTELFTKIDKDGNLLTAGKLNNGSYDLDPSPTS